jgi:hypothetical protein
MKPQYAALLKQVDELAGKVGHKQHTWLRIIVNEGEDQKPAMQKAVAEWMRRHPKAKARSIDDFDWIVRCVAKQWVLPPEQPPGPLSSGNFDYAEDEARRKQSARRLHYPESGWA